jgi:hypothetical protein
LAQIDRSAEGVHATGAACKELQARLLAAAHEIHGADGHHEMVAERWSTWSGRANCSALTSLDEAHQMLEQAAAKLGAPAGWLPWRKRRSDSVRN